MSTIRLSGRRARTTRRASVDTPAAGSPTDALPAAVEPAALDLVGGSIGQAMRMIAAGLARAGHASAVTTLVPTGLGVPWEQARSIVRKPLPSLLAAQPAAAASPAPKARRVVPGAMRAGAGAAP